MQIKQTFPKSYLSDKERQEAIKKIYRQLHAQLKHEPGKAKGRNKTGQKESLC